MLYNLTNDDMLPSPRHTCREFTPMPVFSIRVAESDGTWRLNENVLDSRIQLKEFLDIVRKKKEAHLYCNEVRHIFTAFDRHYRGYLTLEDFKKAFKQVAPKLSERIILEVFRGERRSEDHRREAAREQGFRLDQPPV
ncbi:hypothetical protein Celaphus_00005897, partial [Cervus elaphus hippelaphus]